MSEPSVEGFLERLASVPDEYLECRTLRHAWQSAPLRVVDTRRENRSARGGNQLFAERRIRCSRCGMLRSDAYLITSAAGHTALRKIGSTYPEIPPGYYVRNQGRLDIALVLGAQFERDVVASEAPPKRRRRATDA